MQGRISSMSRSLCSVRREYTVSEGLHLQYKDNMCGLRRNSAVSGMSHLQYEEKICGVPGGLHLQYEEKVVHCK